MVAEDSAPSGSDESCSDEESSCSMQGSEDTLTPFSTSQGATGGGTSSGRQGKPRKPISKARWTKEEVSVPVYLFVYFSFFKSLISVSC